MALALLTLESKGIKAGNMSAVTVWLDSENRAYLACVGCSPSYDSDVPWQVESLLGVFHHGAP